MKSLKNPRSPYTKEEKKPKGKKYGNGKRIAKYIVISLLIITLCCLAVVGHTQDNKQYVDTTLNFAVVSVCGTEPVIPAKIQDAISKSKDAVMIVEVAYAGEANIDGKYYKCVVIHKCSVQVRIYANKEKRS